MFFGTYTHNLDDNGRLTVPSKLREAVTQSQEGPCLYLACGAENCIVAYTQARVVEILNSTEGASISRKQARRFKRVFGGEGSMETWDKQGRILLPESLKKHAGITREVAIVGAVDCIEIWDAETYADRRETSRAAYNDIADKIIR